jgi:hypothetical protein
MTIDELYTHLLEEGFGDVLRRYADGISLADFDIQREGQAFRVGQTERGRFCAVDLDTEDEAEACDCYLKGAMRFAWHLAHSSDESFIERQQAILTSAGIWVERNDLPASLKLPDSRYRIFVSGADRKRARQLLGL